MFFYLVESLVWNGLGGSNFLFLEYLSIGNNLPLFIYILFWVIGFLEFNSFESFRHLLFYSYLDCVNIYLYNLWYNFFFNMHFSFYDYYGVMLPLVGIILSLSLNFLIMGAHNMGDFDYILLFSGSQWFWGVSNVMYMGVWELLLGSDFLSMSFDGTGEILYNLEMYYYEVLSSEGLEGKKFSFSEMVCSFIDSFMDKLWNSEFMKVFNITSVNTMKYMQLLDHYVISLSSASLTLPHSSHAIFYTFSLDVIHAIFMALIGIKLDSTPGSFSGGFLDVQNKGEFEFLCAEFCGVQHSIMVGNFLTISWEEFLFMI